MVVQTINFYCTWQRTEGGGATILLSFFLFTRYPAQAFFFFFPPALQVSKAIPSNTNLKDMRERSTLHFCNSPWVEHLFI